MFNSENEVVDNLAFLIDSIFGVHILQQINGVPMWTRCNSLLVDLAKFIHKKTIYITFIYIDDILSINNSN
jgi:hypothetical protein